ncbi:MAG: exodeoxyribonuclease V subunit alpha [Verrucomicrobia bacterium]|nr:exodeoxyribonuclease V subunit alpha [Verrucomicrobiota bacterium]
MKEFERWATLKKCSEQGSLAFVDLAFAASVLKKLGSDQEEHAALLAILFALSRQGHLTLDISVDALAHSLKQLGIVEIPTMSQLLLRGASTFPHQAIADNPQGRCSAWICRLQNQYYLQKNWMYETAILSHLERLCGKTPSIVLSKWTSDGRLNSTQKQAVAKGIENSVSFLTGGPGTGKTFTASEIVKACLSSLDAEQKKHFRIILAAPTGKAVAQLEGNLRKALGAETSFRSGTLHSILGIKGSLHEEEITPLYADLIIVDECSMIDAKIFSRLLASVLDGARLILIGDKDQLPPVEAGSIFADLLDANVYPATQLTECLRSDRAEILTLAKYIQAGSSEAALEFLGANPDIEWTDLEEERKTSSQLAAELWNRCKDRFPSAFSETPSLEQLMARLGAFSILSCMRKGPLGVDALNRYFLNQYLKAAVDGAWWAAPIMIARNDHALELYNGDLGFLVRKVSSDFSLRHFHVDDYALFHDRKGGYRRISALALSSFEYSYCLSVHKSQGSEYDEALILVPTGSELFGREVLYTAVTRARRKVSIAGAKPLLLQAIAISSRKISGLSVRLKRS